MPKKAQSKAGKPADVNKSAWIRAQPSSLKAREVVAKAKAEGIVLDEGLVYKIRSAAKKTGRKRPGSKRASAAPARAGVPSGAKPSTPVKVNKSEWIRQQPVSLKAQEVVAKAKAEGITLSTAQVHTIRSMAKRAGKKPTGRSTRTAALPRAALPSLSATADEIEFRRLVMSIGLSRAESYIATLRQSVGL